MIKDILKTIQDIEKIEKSWEAPYETLDNIGKRELRKIFDYKRKHKKFR